MVESKERKQMNSELGERLLEQDHGMHFTSEELA